jgi:hypothetical protein
MRFLLPGKHAGSHLEEDAKEHQATPRPLHLVEGVVGVPEDRVHGGKDLAPICIVHAHTHTHNYNI